MWVKIRLFFLSCCGLMSYSVAFMDNLNENHALIQAAMTGAVLKIVQNNSTNDFCIEG